MGIASYIMADAIEKRKLEDESAEGEPAAKRVATEEAAVAPVEEAAAPAERASRFSSAPPAEAQPDQSAAYGQQQQPAAYAQQPQQPQQPPAPEAAAGWQTLYDPQQRPYYYNPATGVTQWEKP